VTEGYVLELGSTARGEALYSEGHRTKKGSEGSTTSSGNKALVEAATQIKALNDGE